MLAEVLGTAAGVAIFARMALFPLRSTLRNLSRKGGRS